MGLSNSKKLKNWLITISLLLVLIFGAIDARCSCPSIKEPETITSEETQKLIKSESKKNKTIKYVGGEVVDIDFLAKLVFAEGGTMSWKGQVILCSAILNLCDYEEISVWDAGHNPNMFSVAYHVDNVIPSDTQYEVIDYVFNGGRVSDVCYFRTGHYHNFGTPYCYIDDVYFSSR